LLYFDPPPAHLDVVEFVVVVAYRRGQILYARWREDGCWTLPSGRVEHGQTPEEAARRELLEETGATLKQVRVLCYMHCFMFGREYWGVTYLGEVSELGTPMDLDEVIEASMFADVPANLPREFEGQVRASHHATLRCLADNARFMHEIAGNDEVSGA
jgi:8-oxo-dGTP pyrophosphatase MutT (NUDIX family)